MFQSFIYLSKRLLFPQAKHNFHNSVTLNFLRRK